MGLDPGIRDPGIENPSFGPTTCFMCSWPHPYCTLISGVFPLHQIAHVGRQRAPGP